MRSGYSVACSLLAALLALAGCATAPQDEKSAFDTLEDCSGFAVLRNDYVPSPPAVRPEAHLKPGQWDEMFSTFSEPKDPSNPFYRERLNYLVSHPRHMEHVLKNAEPLIFSVYENVVKAGLKPEIIIIPMIESMYNPAARSPAGYAGLWQFGSQTARNFGLTVSGSVDERMNPHKATQSAVKYLSYLMKFFDGSWTMAVAGYNAGEGRVLNTYKGTGKKASELDFNHLSIPQHTKKYLQSIMAYAHYLKNHRQYGVRLPSGAAASSASPVRSKNYDQKSIRYVTGREFAEIHGIRQDEIADRSLLVEKRYRGNRTFCRVTLSGEYEPYAMALNGNFTEYVLRNNEGLRISAAEALARHANVKPSRDEERKARKQLFPEMGIRQEEHYFASLRAVLEPPARNVSNRDQKTRVLTDSGIGNETETAPADGSAKMAESDMVERKPMAEAKSDGKPVAKTKAEQKPAAKAKTEQKPTAKAKAEQKPAAKAKAEQKPAAKAKAEQKPAAKAKAEQKPAAKAKSEQKPAAKAKAEQKPAAKAKSEQKPAAKAKAEQKPAAKAKSEQKPAAKAKAEQKPAAKAKAEQKPAAKAKSEQKPTTKAKTEKKPAAKSDRKK